jgi:hypothetical protein
VANGAFIDMIRSGRAGDGPLSLRGGGTLIGRRRAETSPTMMMIMERSAFDLYPRELQVLRDRASRVIDCLEALPRRAARERWTDYTIRLNAWRWALNSQAVRYFKALLPWTIPAAISARPSRLELLLLIEVSVPRPSPLDDDVRTYAEAIAGAVTEWEQRCDFASMRSDIECEIEELYIAHRNLPKWTVEGDGGKKSRNELFIRWHDIEGMGPAPILDRWNELPDEERQQRFPNAWQKLESKSRNQHCNQIAHIVGEKSRKVSAK